MNKLKDYFSFNKKERNGILLLSLYISKANINTVTIEKLRNHPYLNYKQAKMIVNYRDQHGNYHQLKDICKIKPINPELFRKIAPYFQTHD